MKPAAPPGSKPSMRIAVLEARSALDDRSRLAAARAVAERTLPLVPAGATVSLYAPLRGEIDCGLLAMRLDAVGHRLALPVVVGRNEPLAFRHWRPGDVLRPGFGGILEPSSDERLTDPDVLLLPLAAFDRNLNRLGYGAGFYDRTLESLRAVRPRLAIGLAFAVQEVASVPTERHDVALTFVVTEDAVLAAPQLCDSSS